VKVGQDFMKLYGPIRLARSTTECWKCKKETPVSAIIAAAIEEVEDGKGLGKYDEETFVYEIEQEDIPTVLQNVLARLAPNYKAIYSRTGGFTQWANTCVHCGSLQGAFYMHMEPDGPFFGRPEHFTGEVVHAYPEDVRVDGASFTA
jgi:hypothetical protein